MGNNASRIETWTLYGLGTVVIFMRIACRWRTVGPSRFKPDDYIIFLSWATYTTMTYAADVVGALGDMHALPIDQRKLWQENIHSKEAQALIHGTQWFCASIATYILFIWTLKLNMLFLYQRIVRGLWVEKFIKPAMFLVVATFVTNMIILFGACRPYNRMWTIYPDQGVYCQPQSTLNMVVPLVLNLLTDVMIAAIPAPVIFKVHNVHLWKRVFLFVVFGAVTFIMTAAILRVVFVLIYQSGPVTAIWSCREDIVAILVGQSFLIRPMFRRSFWRKQNPGDTHQSDKLKNSENSDSSFRSRSKWSTLGKAKDPFSITAALATVTDEAQYPQQRERQQPHGDNGSASSVDDEPRIEPAAPGHPREQMVIHVSKRVSIEKEPIDRMLSSHIYQLPADILQSTTYSRAWRESPV